MANLNETAKWENDIYLFATDDYLLGGKDGTLNVQPGQLANRTRYLKKHLDKAQSDLDDLQHESGVHHQMGSFTIYNRGIKTGCDLSKAQDATRNFSLTDGSIFMDSREVPVVGETNAASVPQNTDSHAATAEAFLYIDGDGAAKLGVTGLNESSPDVALVLAMLSIPAGSTDISDPHLSNVSVSPVARKEPEWPGVQVDPAVQQVDFPAPMADSDYQITLDVLSFNGGERPVLSAPESDRSKNTFRAHLAGMADAVHVRYVAHLITQ